MFKADRMLDCAHKVHLDDNGECLVMKQRRSGAVSARITGMENFTKLDMFFDMLGGISWTWKKLWDKSILTEEGVFTLLSLGSCRYLLPNSLH